MQYPGIQKNENVPHDVEIHLLTLMAVRGFLGERSENL